MRRVENVAEIIRADLSRSGQFRLINATGANLDENSQIAFGEWSGRGADYLAYGSVSEAGGQYTISYRLVDNFRQTQLDAVAFAGNERELRRLSHRIADRIYEKITGVRGVFSTRIAYVLQTGDTYELQIADADGQNHQVMLRSKHSIISPAWSPDGKQLAYVSFEHDKPVVTCKHWRQAAAFPSLISRATTVRPHGRPTVTNWLWCCPAMASRKFTR